MKFNLLLPILGSICSQVKLASSTRLPNARSRSILATVPPFPPPPLVPSLRSHPSLPRSSDRKFGGHKRSRSGDRSEAMAGVSHIRAGDSAAAEGNADDITPEQERMSPRGGASVAVSNGPEEKVEIECITPASPSAAGANVSLDEMASHTQISKKLKNRNHTNLSRKFTHAAFGMFFASLNQFLPRAKFLPGMTVLTSATLLMELLRYHKYFHWMNDVLHFFLGSSLRKHEMEGKFTGSFYYFAGVTASSYLYPKTAATLGICQLALADPSASYFGQRTRHVYWSRIENGLGGFGRNKGLLGFLGGALFCLPFNYRVLSIARWAAGGVPGGRLALVAGSLLLGLAGAFADLAVPTPAITMPRKICGVPVPPFHIDDNFVVPIFSGFACTKIFDLLGWDSGLELAKQIIFNF